MLAVLNSGSESDDTREVLERFRDFEVGFIQHDRGLKVSLKSAPSIAFVDGKMIRGTRELLFSVLRDIVFTRNEIIEDPRFSLEDSASITNAVFHILRNARMLTAPVDTNLVVCWGGHAITREEYDYTKLVGYEFGLRGLDVCTGCGPGAMKGPMKGATIGHAKQRVRNGRYLGITEPGIIAAESPNPIVNSLVIMPDMEKRLEAFVLGIMLHPSNDGQPMPMVMTGPPSAAAYFEQIDDFVAQTLGPKAQSRYRIIVGDPPEVARTVAAAMNDVRDFRKQHGDAFYFNWRLKIDERFQKPFTATHESMQALHISEDLPSHELAANLRRAFSGIVSGNVREDTAMAIEQNGPFTINGSERIMKLLDALLRSFVAQQRMKLSGADYQPCYRVIA